MLGQMNNSDQPEQKRGVCECVFVCVGRERVELHVTSPQTPELQSPLATSNLQPPTALAAPPPRLCALHMRWQRLLKCACALARLSPSLGHMFLRSRPRDAQCDRERWRVNKSVIFEGAGISIIVLKICFCTHLLLILLTTQHIIYRNSSTIWAHNTVDVKEMIQNKSVYCQMCLLDT